MSTTNPVATRGFSLARNVTFLVVAKGLSAPITMLNNAIMARFLGAEDFGEWFVAQAYATFAGLVINWGQDSTLAAATARDRSRASDLLGSGLLLRVCTGLAVLAVAGLCLAATHPGRAFRIILIVVFVHRAVSYWTSTYQDVLRGFERTDVDAFLNVLGPLFRTVICVVVLVPGGRVPSLMIAGMALNVALSFVPRRALAAAGVRPAWSRETVASLTRSGYPFLLFGMATSLQPAVDAAFLSRLTPPDVVGWHAVANRFVGTLCFPATALLSSLYPVLCRLYVEDRDAFRRRTSSALRIALLLVIPLALGCYLFPDLAIRLFSRQSYGPAEDNLRILSVYVVALYVTMPLGTALLAAGAQVRWAAVQCICVVVSLALDPPLVHWFQAHSGNGGLGVCVSSVLSEAIMVVGALFLLPRGTLDRSVFSGIRAAVLGGVAMAITARVLCAALSTHASIAVFVAAPVSFGAYLACLVASGGIGRAEMETIRRNVTRRFSR